MSEDKNVLGGDEGTALHFRLLTSEDKESSSVMIFAPSVSTEHVGESRNIHFLDQMCLSMLTWHGLLPKTYSLQQIMRQVAS